MITRITAIGLVAATLFFTAAAGEDLDRQETISEVELRRMSDAAYTELLRQSERKGHRFSATSIANGYRRHLEELRARLIKEGYTILAGEAGA